MIYWILVGALAGYIGGQIMRGSGFGLLGNIVIGIIGAIIGGWVSRFLGIRTSGEFIGPLITAVAGAVILLWAVGLADGGGRKRRR